MLARWCLILYSTDDFGMLVCVGLTVIRRPYKVHGSLLEMLGKCKPLNA